MGCGSPQTCFPNERRVYLVKVVKVCKTHKKASLSSCLLWLWRELALSPKQHSTINHNLPKIFSSGSRVNMKTHMFYWCVCSAAQPSSVRAAGTTFTWVPSQAAWWDQSWSLTRALSYKDNRSCSAHSWWCRVHGMSESPGRKWGALMGQPQSAGLERGQCHGALGKFPFQTPAPLHCIFF